MSAGFGFSVGDFIAAIRVVGTVVEVLRDAGAARREFAELAQLLATLEVSLRSVTEIGSDGSYEAYGPLLQRAATQCQSSVEDFWQRVRKCQPQLQSQEWGSKVKESWAKVRWALCKREDVQRFKADVQCQVVAVQLVLSTLQLKQHKHLEGTASRISYAVDACASQLTNLAIVGDERTQCQLALSDKIAEQNRDFEQSLAQLHRQLLRIPAQIERQPPVYLRDALDKDSPFHLEFIRSAEALLYVLRLNLVHVRSGVKKIDRREFSILEQGSSREIDLSQNWETLFFPGQRVGMSMLFYLPRCSASVCPSCESPSESSRSGMRCASCGVTIHRLEVRRRDLVKKTALSRLVERSDQPADTAEEVRPFRRIQVLDVVPDKPMVSILSSQMQSSQHSSTQPEQPMIEHGSPRISRGCYRIVERQALCGCVTHEHGTVHATPCACRGDPHRVAVKEVFVAYSCSQHPPTDIQACPSPGDSSVPAIPNLQDPNTIVGKLPTPPSLSSEEPVRAPPGLADDARRAVAELDTPPESPELVAQSDRADQSGPILAAPPLALDGEVRSADAPVPRRDIGKASVLPTDEELDGPDVRTHVPAAMPVTIPTHISRLEVEDDEDMFGRSWGLYLDS